GSDVFERVRTGNGSFVVSAEEGNTGTGVVSVGEVVSGNPSASMRYEVVFSVADGVTTYDVIDSATGTTIAPAARPYTEGASIEVGGLQFSITGQPEQDDVFTIAPSQNKSVFASVEELIGVLKQPL